MSKFWNWYGSTTYYLRRHIKSVKCFFTGHDIKWGCEEMYEPGWKDHSCDMWVFRDYMNTVFVWIIEHTTEEFANRLLSWKPVKQMPNWWEY